MPVSPQLVAAASFARQELDQEHPWVPGGCFMIDPELKPLLIAFLDTLIAEETSTLIPQKCGRCGQYRDSVTKVGPYTACETCAAVIGG